MALTGRRAAHTFFAFPFGTLLSFFPSLSRTIEGRAGNAADTVTARSLASVGLIGLLGLPLLMLASVILEAPLAAPAVISLGYFGAARALLLGDGRRAAFWMLAVFGGFVSWTLLSYGGRQPPFSGAQLAAALLAPAFAAAPAVARRLTVARPDQDRRASPAPIALSRRTTPFGEADGFNAPEPVAAELAPNVAGGVRPALAAAAAQAAALEPTSRPRGSVSDLQDAVAFALRHVGPKARCKGISLICSGDSTLAVACDRQVSRRILNALLAEVVRASPLGAHVHVLARGLKGAVLLRISCTGGGPGEAEPAPFDLSAIRLTVDEIGGTLIATETSDGLCASLRLARAGTVMRQGPSGLNSGAA